MHHVSIRTANIHQAIAFYGHLGFTVKERFTTGFTLACWLEGLGGRLELIQIPEPKPTVDAFFDEHYVGYYHLSFDLTGVATTLPLWLEQLRHCIEADTTLEKGLTILLAPQQQMIGDRLYELAFIADGDGLPLEFLRIITESSKS